MYINKILFYLRWVLQCKFLNKKIPLNGSIIINDKCNLSCRHCVVSNLGYKDLSFKEIKNDLLKLYNTGSRVLIITGGEPFLWKDNNYSLDDAIKYAKDIGFFRVVICTNGTFKLDSCADYLWVSLDGFPEEHNKIRGNIYESVIKNITSSRNKDIFINFTISKLNFTNFEKAADSILKLKNVRGILFHIFTPYLRADKSIILSKNEKQDVLNGLYNFKKKNPLKITNTFAGIKALINDDWERNLWSSVTINRGELSLCCCRKGIYDENVCKECGCSPAVETWVLEKLSLTAIIENLRFL